MKKRALSLLLAACLLPLGGCAGRLHTAPDQAAAPTEIAVALEKDCPQPVVNALQTFCDDIYRLSDKTLYASLQHWGDITEAQAEILFLPDEPLFSLAPELRVLQTDFLFNSYEHFNAVMNAPTILQELNRSLAGYSIYLTTYGGKPSLLSAGGSFVEALRSDETETIRETVEAIAAGELGQVEPADFSRPPEEDRLYYASTTQLGALTEQEASDYIIISLNYRYHFNLLCLQDGLEQRLSGRQLAAIYEAAATLKPACDKAYQAMDTQGSRRFASAILPSQKLQRIVREMQASASLPALSSTLYQHIWKYSG